MGKHLEKGFVRKDIFLKIKTYTNKIKNYVMNSVNNTLNEKDIKREEFTDKRKKLVESLEILLKEEHIIVRCSNIENIDNNYVSIYNYGGIYVGVGIKIRKNNIGYVSIAIDNSEDKVNNFLKTGEGLFYREKPADEDRRSIKYMRLAMLLTFSLISHNSDLKKILIIPSDKNRYNAYKYLKRYGFKEYPNIGLSNIIDKKKYRKGYYLDL